MITLSGFGFEEKIKNPSSLFKKTFKDKSFINGTKVKEFEEQFQKFTNAYDCAAVSSCTSALHLSLLALGIGPGDEVITVPYTWISTVEVIKQVGAKPVFVDINENDLCIDVSQIKNKINKNTKAIIGVDLFGNVCDIDKLKQFNLPVIEDAAQSTGAVYKGKRVGSLDSTLTCFSFYPTKNLSCWGDAGAVTGDAVLISKIKELRNHGQTKKFVTNQVGWNARMDSIQAEILLNKLPHLDTWNKRRREIALHYSSELQNIVTTPKQNANSLHVYHQYIIHSVQIDRIQNALKNKGIESRRYYSIPLHQTKPYADGQKYKNTEYSSNCGLAIPVHQYLTDKEVNIIIKTIKNSL